MQEHKYYDFSFLRILKVNPTLNIVALNILLVPLQIKISNNVYFFLKYEGFFIY